MKKKITIIGLLILLTLGIGGCGQSFQRDLKGFTSEYGGGLNRTLTVYDMTGKPIKSYSGKFDIQSTEGGKILFDLNGKRTIIYNATVIVEEN